MKQILFFILCGLITSVIVRSQWVSNPSVNTSVCVTTNDQQDHRVASDCKGGVIITWLDYRNGFANGDIYAQRIDKNGYAKWTTNGIAICSVTGSDQLAPDIVEDGTGGAIIVWQDWRNGNRDIYAQSIDSNGIIQWTTNGIEVCIKSYDQQNPKIITDGFGGAIIVWQDSANGSWDIYAQRLNSNGASQWTTDGIPVCIAVGDQINPKINADGSGGAVITWQDKRYGVDYDIYAQRINASGSALWATNGVAVCVTSNTQNNPKIRSDGSGGAIVAWADKRYGNYDIYAQYLNSSGVPQWATNGIIICAAPDNQSAIDMATDYIDGVIITWKDSRSGTNIDIYAQKVSFSGTTQWTNNGVAICTAQYDQINPDMIGDGTGGAIIVWQDARNSTNGDDVYAQRIDANGTILWVTNGVVVGSATNNQTSPKHEGDGNGGAIVVFQDKRSGTFDIYTHHIDSNGVSNISEWKGNNLQQIDVFPNPASDVIVIQVASCELPRLCGTDCELRIYDLLGNEVIISSIQQPVSSIQLNLPAGVYFYSISIEGIQRKSGQFIKR